MRFNLINEAALHNNNTHIQKFAHLCLWFFDIDHLILVQSVNLMYATYHAQEAYVAYLELDWPHSKCKHPSIFHVFI